jgi:Aerotolerance regulator N-terminal
MTFLHLSLIAGLGVMSIPVLLHMFGQRQPQLIDFPALKFVRQTTRDQSRSWQLRHWLLLLLRMLLLAAIALAMSRPRVHTALLGSILGISSLGVLATIATIVAAVAHATRRPFSIRMTCLIVAIGIWLSVGVWAFQALTTGPAVPSSDQSSPVAAALIVDNGPTMSYRANNQFRLDAAKEMALWILDKLPIDSRVGLLGGAPIGSLALDPATAKSQVKLLELRGSHIDLVERIRNALNLVLKTQLARKEIYVVTDLASSGWSGTTEELRKLLAEHSTEVLLQIIDVGVPENANWRLGDAKAEFQTIPEGGETSIEVSIERPAEGGRQDATIKLFMEELNAADLLIGSDGKLKSSPNELVASQNVSLSTDRMAVVQLKPSKKLDAGAHNFTVRLEQNDPIKLDNERYVTVMVQAMRSTLVVADDVDLARFLQYTIDPSAADAARGTSMCEQIRYVQLSRVQLEKYAVICLYDPPLLTAPQAQSMKEHVQAGGGLLLILGPNQGSAEAIAKSPLQALLPGKIIDKKQRDPKDRSCFFQTAAVSHPVFHAFGQVSTSIPWNAFPVFTHWQLGAMVDGAQTLITYNDGSGDAVVIHPIGRGQVITLTTPIPEPARRDAWNELTTGADTWPSFFLIRGCIGSLSGADQTRFNYTAGENILLTNDPLQWPNRYELFSPESQSVSIEAKDGMLAIGQFESPGIYRLKGARTPPIARAVSVNVPAADTVLNRLDQAELTQRLGEGNFRFARSQNEIESSVGQVRYGRELYSLLMLFVAGLFLAEQAMSNRFYKLTFGGAKAT